MGLKENIDYVSKRARKSFADFIFNVSPRYIKLQQELYKRDKKINDLNKEYAILKRGNLSLGARASQLELDIDSQEQVLNELEAERDSLKGLVGHLKSQNYKIRKSLVLGFRELLSHPLYQNIGLAISDESGKIILAPKSIERVGEKLKGKVLKEYNVNCEARDFQYVKIAGKNYAVLVSPLNLRDETNYLAVFTKPTLKQNAGKIVAYSHEKIESLLRGAYDALDDARKHVENREIKKALE